MMTSEILKQRLKPLDGKDYGAYQSLLGAYSYPDFTLYFDQIQKDPYAPPSTGIFRVRVVRENANIPFDMTDSRIKEVALRDYLARQFHHNCVKISPGRRGTGYSGIITITEPQQEILERSSIIINDECIEARFFIGLPASGRAITATIAETMLFDELPQIVRLSLYADNLRMDEMYQHLRTAEDAEVLRNTLTSLDLIAFIADGSVLPRASGVDPKPLTVQPIVPFQSPESLRVEIELPHAGTLSGMGIPKGVTLIVGGGYHGKSTALDALALGIYNHIPGDGREYCVSLPNTIKVRASSGRSVVQTDISTFINNLPLQHDTTSFSTENASGSTSQAASLLEAIEVGAEVILMDEDTCAANFMIRDTRMQQLVLKKHEPITSFLDKARQLYEEKGISIILVMGGSGDYFDVADHVIHMRTFLPYDVTQEAYHISKNFPTGRENESGQRFGSPLCRIPIAESLNPYNEYQHLRISAPDLYTLIFGQTAIDLSDVEQLVESAQTKAIGRAIYYAQKYMDGKKTMRDIIDRVIYDIENAGIDILDEQFTGDLASFRGCELAAALNRIRGIEVKQVPSDTSE